MTSLRQRPTDAQQLPEPVSLGRGIAWFGFLAIVGAGLLALGSAAPIPPLDVGRLDGWFQNVGPAGALLAMVRVVALGTVVYLVLVSVSVTVARRRGVANAVLDSATPHLVRAALTGVTTATLVAAVPAGAISAAVAGPNLATPVLTQNRQGLGEPTADLEPPVMRQAPHAAESPGSPGSPGSTGGRDGSEEAVDPNEPNAPDRFIEPSDSNGSSGSKSEVPDIWFVEPGDHLWAIAQEVLGDHLDESPTADQVTDYWQRLIDGNRQTLVDPNNPDLIQPGQILALPKDL